MTDLRVDDDADDPGERSPHGFEVAISDDTFSFKNHRFEDALVTAAQVAEAVGAHPVTQFKIMQQLKSGEIETKRPTETTDLREAGIERMFVIRGDRTFGFTVDGLSLEWPKPITGAHLRILARAGDHQNLVRVTADGFKVVGDNDLVSFKDPETEEFRLVDRKTTVTIFYREEPFEVERRRWTTEQLIDLFKVKAGYKLDIIKPDGEFKEMKPGESIEVREGMEFTSHVPSGQSS
ncbi:MAG TPA: multiubiquitin domain-containing protein [Pararhizobium sp.]|uniref:multiubiquitin domain-containing protein n=1 Tax=Pararhizobium sp. TaxID=1977563 RepID=UPI002C731EE4|nr:multiubiquitin domain-containing protein [Pararhizobium sp.]HTO32595.1 multiubiquitin domain-containing protein [Pararhizobium sp.]